MEIRISDANNVTYIGQMNNLRPKVSNQDFADVFSAAKENLTLGAENAHNYMDIFKAASDRYGVSVNLLTAMAFAESNFDANANSHVGAMGMMQLMPATVEQLGVDNPYDPYENIMGGASLIAKYLKKYNGDLSLALSAYNAGPGNVTKYGGVPPFKETQNYIKKIKTVMANGSVKVPNKAYNATDYIKNTNDLSTDVEKLLSEFSVNDTFEEFVSLLEKQMSAIKEDN